LNGAGAAQKAAKGMNTKIAIARLVLAGALAVVLSGAAVGETLITESESALPPNVARGITSPPNMVVVTPPPTGGAIRSPFALKVRFEASGGARVDPDAVYITYMRIPSIDLTQRVRRYISAEGIEMANAEAPVGTHRIRVDIKDTNGRLRTLDFTFTVIK